MANDKICRLCGSDSRLVSSHAIPASALRKTKNNGKNVRVKNGSLDEKSQSDGKAPLLCAECDLDFLGKTFEKKGTDILYCARRSEQKLLEKDSSLDVADMLAGWTLSILWRAHHLETPEYDSYRLPEGVASDIQSNLLMQKTNLEKYYKWSKFSIVSIYLLVDKFDIICDHQAICAFPSLFQFPARDDVLYCSSFRMFGYEFRVIHNERKHFGIKRSAREVLRSGQRVFTPSHHFLDNPYYADQLGEFAFLRSRSAAPRTAM